MLIFIINNIIRNASNVNGYSPNEIKPKGIIIQKNTHTLCNEGVA